MNLEEISNDEQSSNCYFCKLDLKKESKKEIIELKCCGMKAHKKEIFQWYLQKPYCPNCLKDDSKSRKKIMDWGKKQKKK